MQIEMNDAQKGESQLAYARWAIERLERVLDQEDERWAFLEKKALSVGGVVLTLVGVSVRVLSGASFVQGPWAMVSAGFALAGAAVCACYAYSSVSLRENGAEDPAQVCGELEMQESELERTTMLMEHYRIVLDSRREALEGKASAVQKCIEGGVVTVMALVAWFAFTYFGPRAAG